MAKKPKEVRKDLMDLDTGEIYTNRSYLQEQGDSSFVKVFWKEFGKRMGEVDAKTAVAIYLIGKGCSGYVINMSVSEIADEVKISVKSAQRSLTSLCSYGMIKRKGERQILVNPRVVFKGDKFKRLFAIKVYDEIG